MQGVGYHYLWHAVISKIQKAVRKFAPLVPLQKNGLRLIFTKNTFLNPIKAESRLKQSKYLHQKIVNLHACQPNCDQVTITDQLCHQSLKSEEIEMILKILTALPDSSLNRV